MLLLAFLIYNDGIQTIIRMATTFGTQIGIDQNAMITALLITQFIGIPFAFLFGMLAARIGAKTAVFGGLSVYAVIVAARLLHDQRGALLRARHPGRHGAGRHAGAQPLALRQHDPEAQVVGVLRLLRRVRALCRHPRTAGVRGDGRGHRPEPERDPRGAGLLRRRRRAARIRRCRGGTRGPRARPKPQIRR